MPLLFARLCLVLACCLFAACGSQADGLLRLDPGPDDTAPSPYVAKDPKGPIPEPSLPPEFAAAGGGEPSIETVPTSSPGERKAPSLNYSVEVVSPDAPTLADAFLAVSRLEQMRDKPVVSVMGLDQRMRSDLDVAKDVLHSCGYYAGRARGKITRKKPGGQPGKTTPAASANAKSDAEKGHASGVTDAGPPPPDNYLVTITFEPGIQYVVGKTRVSVTDPARLKPAPARENFAPPATTLADVGLQSGDPALAGSVLDAVSAVRENFRDRGYPFASIASSRYIVDHGSQTLDVELVMDSGPLVFMDGLEIKGESPVKKRYLDALTTWESGAPWNQARVEDFRNNLRRSGLFSSAELTPAETEDEQGLRAIVVELTEAPPRTVGGALKYDTDFGPGVQAYWEHRNITGRGDRLRLEAPIWADLQELVATYRLPFFMRRDQDFTARAAYRHENTDAYELTSYLASAGIERRFTPRWTGAVAVYAEGGEMKDPDESMTSYSMIGLPTSLVYNNTNSLLDATRGVRLNVGVAPYTGQYREDFTVVRTRVEGQAFIPVIGENALVLALRGMYGLISDANAQDVPATLRYYAGGGGSVRGYEYQSLGPRNDSGDPLGGASAVELSAEARARFTDMWGLVAFIDGGMAYSDAAANFSEDDLRWGAGLGIRMYTAIGPVRLDFAVPLNPRDDDDNFQVYFSIGQSF